MRIKDLRGFNEASLKGKEVKNSGLSCYDRNIKKAQIQIPSKAMESSFNEAIRTADGVELFSVLEKEKDEIEHRVILKNMKDNWREDIKDISAPREEGFAVGNTVRWLRYGIRWIIVSQDLIYTSYFRGEIRRADYKIRWKNENGNIVEQWASIRGPVETKNKFEQTRGNTVIGKGNDTLEILIGANDNHKWIDSLKRYSLFKMGGRTWKILVVDNISNMDVYRMSCMEDYTNTHTEDAIEGIPGGKIDFGENDIPTSVIKVVGPTRIKSKSYGEFYLIDENENIIDSEIKVKSEKRLLVNYEKEDKKWLVYGTKIGDRITVELFNGELKNEIKDVLVVSPLS